jgi:hypothetical protein
MKRIRMTTMRQGREEEREMEGEASEFVAESLLLV